MNYPPDQRTQVRINLVSPSPWARFPTPVAAKAGTMPAHEGLGSDGRENIQDRREPSIQLDIDQRSVFVSRTRS